MEPVLEVSSLIKKYGRKVVLNKTEFTIKTNRIVGLLGPNGSGKTTLIKIITGLLHQNSGSVKILGKDVSYETKLSVSFMPDTNNLYNWMKVKDAIKFYSDFFQDFDVAKSHELSDFMKLNLNDPIKSLSKGMLERLLLTLTLSRKTSLYVLDEPLGGVDPAAKSKIIDSILDYYSSENCSLLISTHLIKDVERLFDDVLFLKSGQITLSGDCETLREQNSKTIEELYLEVFEND